MVPRVQCETGPEPMDQEPSPQEGRSFILNRDDPNSATLVPGCSPVDNEDFVMVPENIPSDHSG